MFVAAEVWSSPAEVVGNLGDHSPRIHTVRSRSELEIVVARGIRFAFLGRAGLRDMTLHDMVVQLVGAQPDQTAT